METSVTVASIRRPTFISPIKMPIFQTVEINMNKTNPARNFTKAFRNRKCLDAEGLV